MNIITNFAEVYNKIKEETAHDLDIARGFKFKSCPNCEGQGFKYEWSQWDESKAPAMVDCEECNGTGDL